MARRIPQDHNYRTTCPAAIKAKITALETAAIEYAFKGTHDPEDYDAIIEDAQVARYNLERAILTAIEKAVVEAHQAVRKHAAYHVSEIEGCLDEYEDMPCTSLRARLRSAIARAKATFK